MTRTADPRDLAARLLAHLRTAALFPRPGVALVAVSGGPDSVALLHLLADLSDELDLEPVVGHVDHGISRSSAAWARAVAAIAATLDLSFVQERLALGAASETRARRERYRAFRRLQREVGARYLVTAHHADDQAETVLYRLLRGSGPAGLAGIPARGPGGLVRPLLPFTRAELTGWLATRAPGVAVVTDPANADLTHDRSWLREALLPMVRGRFPDVDRRLLRRNARRRSIGRPGPRSWPTIPRSTPPRWRAASRLLGVPWLSMIKRCVLCCCARWPGSPACDWE
jgi:tRNA(Ile)-lysidine synthase